MKWVFSKQKKKTPRTPLKIEYLKMTYKVIQSKDNHGGYLAFVEDVTNHANDGWELVGGVCVSRDEHNNAQFYQAMTKYGNTTSY